MKKLARRQTEDGQNNGDKEKKNNQNKSVNKKKKEDEVNGKESLFLIRFHGKPKLLQQILTSKRTTYRLLNMNISHH